VNLAGGIMPKLVLFDIDETILHSDGVGRRAMQAALTKVLGKEIDAAGHNMSGKTDPQICHELLGSLGYEEDFIERQLPLVFNEYVSMLEHEIAKAQRYQLHIGVIDLISILAQDQRCRLALLTGNIETGARLKLRPFDLNKYFPTGAFGSDAADRLKLPQIAHNRAHEVFPNVRFNRTDIVVIGDAVNDVLCAKGYGVKSVVTCTGRTTRAELEPLKPDYMFNSLEDTGAVCNAIFA
jgi:phosphoglycolate phosphatase